MYSLNIEVRADTAKVVHEQNFPDRYSIDSVAQLEMDSFVGIENAINNGHGGQVVDEYNGFCDRLSSGIISINTIYNPVMWKIGVWLDALRYLDDEDIRNTLGPVPKSDLNAIKSELNKLMMIGYEITKSIDPEILTSE